MARRFAKVSEKEIVAINLFFICFYIYLIASTEYEKTRSPYEHAPYLHKHILYNIRTDT